MGTDAFTKALHPRLILMDWSCLWELEPVAEGGVLPNGKVLEVTDIGGHLLQLPPLTTGEAEAQKRWGMARDPEAELEPGAAPNG